MNEYQEKSPLEKQLGAVLSPVAPQTDFVSELQERLKKKALIAIERPDYLLVILLITGGLLIGVIGILLLKMIFGLKKESDQR